MPIKSTRLLICASLALSFCSPKTPSVPDGSTDPDPMTEPEKVISAEVQARRNAALPDDAQSGDGRAPAALHAVYSRSDETITLEWERPSSDPAAQFQYGIYRSYINASGQSTGAAEQVLLADNSILRTVVAVPKKEGQTPVFNVVVATPSPTRDGVMVSYGEAGLAEAVVPTPGTVAIGAKCAVTNPDRDVLDRPTDRRQSFWVSRTTGEGMTSLPFSDTFANSYTRPAFFDSKDSLLIGDTLQSTPAGVASLSAGIVVRAAGDTFTIASAISNITAGSNLLVPIAARVGSAVAFVTSYDGPTSAVTGYQIGGVTGTAYTALPAADTSLSVGATVALGPQFGWVGGNKFAMLGFASAAPAGAALALVGRVHTVSETGAATAITVGKSVPAGALDTISIDGLGTVAGGSSDITASQGRTLVTSWYGKSTAALIAPDREIAYSVSLPVTGAATPLESIAILDSSTRKWLPMNQRPSFDSRLSTVVGSADGKYLAAMAHADGAAICLYIWPSNEDANFIGKTDCSTFGKVTALALGGAVASSALQGLYFGTWLPEAFSSGTLGTSQKLIVRRTNASSAQVLGAVDVSGSAGAAPTVSLRTDTLMTCSQAGQSPFYVSYRSGGTALSLLCLSQDFASWDLGISESLAPVASSDVVSSVTGAIASWAGVGPEDEISAFVLKKVSGDAIYDFVAGVSTPLTGITRNDGSLVLSGSAGARAGLVMSRGAQESDFTACSGSPSGSVSEATLELIEKNATGWARTGDVMGDLPDLPSLAAGDKRIIFSWPEWIQNGDVVLLAVAKIPAAEMMPPRCGGVDPLNVRYYSIDLKACSAGRCRPVNLTPAANFNCRADQKLVEVSGVLNRFSFAE